MSDYEITDLGKFLEEQTESIVENDTEVGIDEEDVLVTNPDSEQEPSDDEYNGDMSEHCEDFCMQSMRMYVNVHLWHLQTGSHSEHEALEDYYEDLFELTDTFIETAIANDGGLTCETSFNLELVPYSEMKDEIDSYKELVESHKEHVTEESMVNILDDILTITDEVRYKLNNLK